MYNIEFVLSEMFLLLSYFLSLVSILVYMIKVCLALPDESISFCDVFHNESEDLV